MMRDVIKDLQAYNKEYGDRGTHNAITIPDIERVKAATGIDNAEYIAQAFCNIGYMRGYRAGLKAAERQGKE